MIEMNIHVVIVQCAILSVQVFSDRTISVTDNFRNKIALEVLKVSPVNTVVSSVALKLPLCKLITIAKGETRIELMSALGIKTEANINCYDQIRNQLIIAEMSELIMHNRIYLNDSITVDPGFMNQSLNDFGVKVGRTGFRYPKAAVKYMNHWAATETLYRVATLIEEEDIDNSTSMVFLSGLHFKGHWEFPFDIRFTVNRMFRDDNNKPVRIPMMVKLDNFDYFDEPNYDVKVLNLKFACMGASITFVMPAKRGSLPALLEKLSSDPNMMKNLKSRLTNTLLKIYLPRLWIKTYVDWTDFLRLIGINKILEANNTDLSGIMKKGTTNEVPVHLSIAKQKVFIEIDELGLSRLPPKSGYYEQRGAMEMSQFAGTAQELALDQPFYFVVSMRSSDTEHELFNGVFRGPDSM